MLKKNQIAVTTYQQKTEGNTISITHHKLFLHVSKPQDKTTLGSSSLLQLSECSYNSQMSSDQDPLFGKSGVRLQL
jgi:hypothetical protein